MADYTSKFTGEEIDSRLEKAGTAVQPSGLKTVGGQTLVGSGDIPVGTKDAVKYTSQELTEEQKQQARANINAASLADIQNTDFVTATALPTASASTMGHIYLIGPDANNNYYRYFTQESGGAYFWVSLGSTQIDLSTYATQKEVSQLEAELEGLTRDVTDADLDIADDAGNILVSFKDGEIETKNFNSEGVNEKLDTIEQGAEVNDVETTDADNGDYAIVDENGRILVLFKDGHIKTKNFDSQKEIGIRIRILAIGNSWTCDAFNYLGAVLNDVLGDNADLHIGVCYSGGASLQTHYTNLVNNNTYTFYEWVNNGPSWGKSTKNINTILTLDYWDVIMFQQQSTGADDYSTYQPYLNDCMDLISERVNSPVKFGWNLVRRTMTTAVDWEDISDNAQRLLRETLIQFIVPCGTATENARTTSLDNLGVGGHLTYDGSHLQEGLPCLVETYAAALYFLSLFGLWRKGINGSTFRPVQSWINAHGMDGQANGTEVGVTEANVVLAKKCATIAVNNPYVITDCSNL